MEPPALYPRTAATRLTETLADTPAVLMHGRRQCSKTTLARTVGDSLAFTYLTFDDTGTMAAAVADPVGFVADLPRHAILDDVQRVPRTFTALKGAVDRDRMPGRFLPAHRLGQVLFVPAQSDSLAGRMEILRLFPFSQCELERTEPDVLGCLFSDGFKTRHCERLGPELAERIFLVEELPRWHTNRLKRLVRTPKVHVTDTGVACAVPDLDATSLHKDRASLGRLLETFVFAERRRQSSGHEEPIRFHHFRDKDGYEVDRWGSR